MTDITIYVTVHHLVLEGNTARGRQWVAEQPWRDRLPELEAQTVEEIQAADLTCEVEYHR